MCHVFIQSKEFTSQNEQHYWQNFWKKKSSKNLFHDERKCIFCFNLGKLQSQIIPLDGERDWAGNNSRAMLYSNTVCKVEHPFASKCCLKN